VDPTTCPDDPLGCSANSLGVFSLGVPSSGISNGTFRYVFTRAGIQWNHSGNG
jgi:hypothetical protein